MYTILYLWCVQKEGVIIGTRTGRPKIDNPKKNQTKLRTNDLEAAQLEFCASELGITKSKVLLLGLDKVYQEIMKSVDKEKEK